MNEVEYCDYPHFTSEEPWGNQDNDQDLTAKSSRAWGYNPCLSYTKDRQCFQPFPSTAFLLVDF